MLPPPLSRVQIFSSEVWSHLFPVCVLKGPPFVFSNAVCLCYSLRVGLSPNSFSQIQQFVCRLATVLRWRLADSPIRHLSNNKQGGLLNKRYSIVKLRRKRKVTRLPPSELFLRHHNSACDVCIYRHLIHWGHRSSGVFCSVDDG
jgi:hypothetical protein